MKTIKYVIVFAAILLHARLFAQSDNTDVDKLIEDFMNKWNIPGGQFAMSLNGESIYSKGYGYASTKTRRDVTTSSLFRIASCSKPFTAVAIMQLIQQGKLQLSDIVFGKKGILNRYREIKDSKVLQITINDLLTHKGGWDSSISGDPMFMSLQIAQSENVSPPATSDEIITYVLSNMSLDHEPGTTYAYSNLGYNVLGRVLEKITGKSYGKVIYDNILKFSRSQSMKLAKNLENQRYKNEVSYYGSPGETTAKSVYGDGQTVSFPYGGFSIEAMDSHGGWIGSAEDLLNFLLAVGDNSLISKKSYRIMTTPDSEGDNYAKGWNINSGNIFHTGSLPGTISIMVKATNGYSWALLFNKRNQDNTIFQELDRLGWNAQNYLSS